MRVPQSAAPQPVPRRRFAKVTLGLLMAVLPGVVRPSIASAEEPAANEELVAGFPAKAAIANGKKIVLVSGDDEYRSEEALPQLAKILSTHHGFDCTVLFSVDPKTGVIDPELKDNIPGLEQLADADLMIIATRFRNLPDDQMKHVVDYVESGKPIIGLRTATHAFNIPADREYARYGFNYSGTEYKQGFGRQILGETWISHHGGHKTESTRGIIAPGVADHPINQGIDDGDIWGPTDVYGVRLPLPGDTKTLVLGQVLTGMEPNDLPVAGEKNDPMMPIAWTRSYNEARVFCTTMGAATDLPSEGVRRMLVNATFWALGLEDQIKPDLNVAIVGDYSPSPYGFGDFVKGRKPSDYEQ